MLQLRLEVACHLLNKRAWERMLKTQIAYDAKLLDVNMSKHNQHSVFKVTLTLGPSLPPTAYRLSPTLALTPGPSPAGRERGAIAAAYSGNGPRRRAQEKSLPPTRLPPIAYKSPYRPPPTAYRLCR